MFLFRGHNMIENSAQLPERSELVLLALKTADETANLIFCLVSTQKQDFDFS